MSQQNQSNNPPSGQQQQGQQQGSKLNQLKDGQQSQYQQGESSPMSGAIVNTGVSQHGGKITLTDVEVQDVEMQLLSAIKRFAPTIAEQQQCDAWYKDALNTGIRQENGGAGAIVYLSGFLFDGITQKQWPWVTKQQYSPSQNQQSSQQHQGANQGA
jgi:hypothetical protein